MFGGVKGEELREQLTLTKSNTFEVGHVPQKSLKHKSGLTAEEIESVTKAIDNATTLEEVARLERILRTGHMPESS